MDEDAETPDSSEESGPLGRLLEHSIESSGTAEAEDTPQSNKPGEGTTVSPNYAAGTHEHDDDL